MRTIDNDFHPDDRLKNDADHGYWKKTTPYPIGAESGQGGVDNISDNIDVSLQKDSERSFPYEVRRSTIERRKKLK